MARVRYIYFFLKIWDYLTFSKYVPQSFPAVENICTLIYYIFFLFEDGSYAGGCHILSSLRFIRSRLQNLDWLLLLCLLRTSLSMVAKVKQTILECRQVHSAVKFFPSFPQLFLHDCSHGLRTPNEGNQRYLKNWAHVANKICFGRT